jgi:hypothetical protein
VFLSLRFSRGLLRIVAWCILVDSVRHAAPNCTVNDAQTLSSASFEAVAMFTATHRAVMPVEGKPGNNQWESRMGFSGERWLVGLSGRRTITGGF